MIRKNQSTPSEYHKLILQTEYEQQSQTQSYISQENGEYRTFDSEDLVQKIKQQQGQIKKLLSIIDKYKNKIEEFQQYEQVINEFLARKQEQKQVKRQKNEEKLFLLTTVSQNSKISTEPCKRQNKQLIVPSYSITILCQNQKFQYQKAPLIKFQTPNKNSLLTMEPRSPKDQEKENRQYRTNYKEKNGKETYYRGCKSFEKSNSIFDINHSIQFLDDSEYREELNRRNMIHRIPSLNNMRRIQKCFKLLKS